MSLYFCFTIVIVSPLSLADPKRGARYMKTRKHFSRMRTDRAVTWPSSEPVSTRPIVDRQTPVKTWTRAQEKKFLKKKEMYPPNKLTETTENITFSNFCIFLFILIAMIRKGVHFVIILCRKLEFYCTTVVKLSQLAKLI